MCLRKKPIRIHLKIYIRKSIPPIEAESKRLKKSENMKLKCNKSTNTRQKSSRSITNYSAYRCQLDKHQIDQIQFKENSKIKTKKSPIKSSPKVSTKRNTRLFSPKLKYNLNKRLMKINNKSINSMVFNKTHPAINCTNKTHSSTHSNKT